MISGGHPTVPILSKRNLPCEIQLHCALISAHINRCPDTWWQPSTRTLFSGGAIPWAPRDAASPTERKCERHFEHCWYTCEPGLRSLLKDFIKIFDKDFICKYSLKRACSVQILTVQKLIELFSRVQVLVKQDTLGPIYLSSSEFGDNNFGTITI